MSYMRFPIYAWVGGVCPEDCPSFEPCEHCKPARYDDGVVCRSPDALHHDCNRPEHMTMNLWVRAGVKDEHGVFDPVNYTDEESKQHPGFTSGAAMPLSMFDEIAVARVAQLIEDGQLAETVERARSGRMVGNVGSWALLKALGEDPAARFDALIKASKEPA